MHWHSDRKPIFLRKHEQVLRKTVITTAHGPGTILRDFESLVNYVKERDLLLTAGHQLPRRTLPEINARLSRPIQMGLQHPLQKSYPHIHGLYLLLRASGLTYVEETGKKPRLIVDGQVEQSWAGLNPTERYGALLEAWLLRGWPGILGERDTGLELVPENFQEWFYFFAEIPAAGLSVAGNDEREGSLRYNPGWYNLGLLELFGLVDVRPGLPVSGQGWQIEWIRRTPWGEALRALLHDVFLERSFAQKLQEAGEMPLGVLRPFLQPYFSAWKRDLVLPGWEFRPGVHIFRVDWGNVWRRIALPAEMILDDLASIILDAVRFEHDHLYRFSYRDRFGLLEQVDHPGLDQGPWDNEGHRTDKERVGDLPLHIGQTMTFFFDFGDQWEFDVTLEQVDPAMKVRKAAVLESHGRPPRQYAWQEDQG